MYHHNFSFVDRKEEDMPLCLVGYSFKLVRLIQDVVATTNINNKIREGVCKCIAAKRMRQC